MLKNPAVLQECVKSTNHDTACNVLCDIYDGSVFKSNVLFQESDLTLKLILYQDAFEVVNPLGSARKKHKILGVYLTLTNFDPHFRSNIDQMQLVLLCKEKDLKYFGHDIIFSKMLSDLRDLEVNRLISSEHVFKATLFCIIGDNLGSHCIGGFTENFSTSQYFCRYCLIKRGKDNVSEVGAVRTVESYKQAVKHMQDSDICETEGVKLNSVQFTEIFSCLSARVTPLLGS